MEFSDNLDWCPDFQEGFYAYVLMCSNGRMYKGYTSNFKARMLGHFNGMGSQTTRRNPPLYILHFEQFESMQEARARERYFKSRTGGTWLRKSTCLRTVKPATIPEIVRKKTAEKERIDAIVREFLDHVNKNKPT